MNNSTIYDRKLFKEAFKNIYNDKENKYNFPINNNFLSNIITRWKNNSYRFKKESVLYDMRDNDNRLLLREFRILPIEGVDNLKQEIIEYIIWANAENINRIRVSKNIFIDGTFHHPPGYTQMLIIMYKDIITELKVPGIYILLNSKKEYIYDLIFQSLLNIIFKNNKDLIKFETIVTDQEIALINIVKKYFPNSQRIACLFHYKQDILRNLKSYGLYKKDKKEESNNLLNDLEKLPFIYKGDMKIIEKECNRISKKYPNHLNFINNYFINNKKNFFEDQSLNYHLIPSDCRTNSFLENYNGYIKSKLGKHRETNWVNFMNFIKDESGRIIDKLYNATSNNLKNLNINEQISTVNPFIFSNINNVEDTKSNIKEYTKKKN